MSKELIEELKATFKYHPKGYLIRKKNGKPCGRRANHYDGYARVRVGGRILPAHRIIYAINYGKMPEGEIKHINGNRIDNRIENLRDVSRAETCHNYNKANTSGFPGVYRDTQRQKWRAQIRANNRRIHLGYFTDFGDAVRARKLAKIKYHPSSPEAAKFARELFPCGAV